MFITNGAVYADVDVRPMTVFELGTSLQQQEFSLDSGISLGFNDDERLTPNEEDCFDSLTCSSSRSSSEEKDYLNCNSKSISNREQYHSSYNSNRVLNTEKDYFDSSACSLNRPTNEEQNYFDSLTYSLNRLSKKEQDYFDQLSYSLSRPSNEEKDYLAYSSNNSSNRSENNNKGCSVIRPVEAENSVRSTREWDLFLEFLKLKETRYMTILNECLRCNESSIDGSTLPKEGLKDETSDQINNILYSLEYDDIDHLPQCPNFESNLQFDEDPQILLADFLHIEVNTAHEDTTSTKPGSVKERKSKKLSQFMSKAKTTFLSIVIPAMTISNGIPIAEEVKKLPSSSSPITLTPAATENSQNYHPSNNSTLHPIFHSSPQASCYERIMRQRKKRNLKERTRRNEILNNMNEHLRKNKISNVEVEILTEIKRQLDCLDEKHLKMARQIDNIKTMF